MRGARAGRTLVKCTRAATSAGVGTGTGTGGAVIVASATAGAIVRAGVGALGCTGASLCGRSVCEPSPPREQASTVCRTRAARAGKRSTRRHMSRCRATTDRDRIPRVVAESGAARRLRGDGERRRAARLAPALAQWSALGNAARSRSHAPRVGGSQLVGCARRASMSRSSWDRRPAAAHATRSGPEPGESSPRSGRSRAKNGSSSTSSRVRSRSRDQRALSFATRRFRVMRSSSASTPSAAACSRIAEPAVAHAMLSATLTCGKSRASWATQRRCAATPGRGARRQSSHAVRRIAAPRDARVDARDRAQQHVDLPTPTVPNASRASQDDRDRAVVRSPVARRRARATAISGHDPPPAARCPSHEQLVADERRERQRDARDRQTSTCDARRADPAAR